MAASLATAAMAGPTPAAVPPSRGPCAAAGRRRGRRGPARLGRVGARAHGADPCRRLAPGQGPSPLHATGRGGSGNYRGNGRAR
eukprot:4377855-Lingulodinium_polyedra.AAC.1